MVRGEGGEVLDVGRKRRTVPPATRRALEARDGGRCRWPGCGVRHTDAHHLTRWAEGGETSLQNLALLCRRHHRRAHEGGWTVERVSEEGEGGDGGLTFLRPDGEELPEVAPPPGVPKEAVEELERDHRKLGVEVGEGPPRWDGTEMDVDWALFTLRREPPDGGTEPEGVSAETVFEG